MTFWLKAGFSKLMLLMQNSLNGMWQLQVWRELQESQRELFPTWLELELSPAGAEDAVVRITVLHTEIHHTPSPVLGLGAELGVRKLEVQQLLKMIFCASNQYSTGCSRFNTSKVEGSYNPISCKL